MSEMLPNLGRKGKLGHEERMQFVASSDLSGSQWFFFLTGMPRANLRGCWFKLGEPSKRWVQVIGL